MATRLALAPIRVPFPPKSAPMATAYHRGLYDKPDNVCAIVGLSEMFSITGIIVAVYGILSTNAEAIADDQIIRTPVAARLPPVILTIPLANNSRAPVSSTP